MEQYWMPKELDFKNLRYCLNNYTPNRLYIRDCGGIRENGKYDPCGMVKVDIDLKKQKMNFRKNKSGLHIIVDEQEVFHFPLKYYDKGFSIGYERFEQKGKYKVMVIKSTGENPNDETLPYPERSLFRNVIDRHLMEIFFDNKIELTFHSWWEYPHWKYWTVDKKQLVHNNTTKHIKQNK